MYIITDGKNYVMENPFKQGELLSTTSPLKAKEFTYKQARGLFQRGGKKYSWVKSYHIVEADTGEESENSPYYKGNGGCYIGESDFDYTILDKILNETNSILGLAGWDLTQLNTYMNLLSTELSKVDSAESDIEHALERYKEVNDGKRAQAHKMSKIGYLLDDLRDRHKKIKQCMNYIRVMQNAIEQKYTIEKIKLELSKARHVEYKGRTEYYDIALKILGVEGE